MIKLEHAVLPSPEQMQFVIEGMRNPMNSWDNSDSYVTYNINSDEIFALGNNDHDLMQRLAKAGTDHRKYMRMMTVYVRITAPLYWWKEFDTYKVGTVANSCSTMHKIQEKEFTLDDFSFEHILDDSAWLADDGNLIGELLLIILNGAREDFLETKDKKYWWQMIQLLPSSYNQTRNVMLNYEVLSNMYHSRKNHKLDEWREFCKWIEGLPYSELIIDSEKLEIVEG
jgi:hypothetical protein